MNLDDFPKQSSRRTWHNSYLIRVFLFVSLMVLTVGSLTPVAARTATPPAHHAGDYQPAAAPVPVEPQPGYYSPNTTIEQRHNGEWWFVRPPYASLLRANGNGTYTFAEGWLAGKLMLFTPNEMGGLSIMLLGSDDTWNEFARQGELYTDLAPELRGALRRVLDTALADAPNVPGAMLYVHIPGQGRWIGARGVAERERGIPMVPHDRFRVASISKVFVATVILQMVEEGTLSLDDTVEQWMPGLVPAGERITIRHLLNHTSGIYNYLDGPFVAAFLSDRARIWSQHELVTYAVSHPAYFAPGEPGRWYYSNTNYVLLSMIVEHATGTSVGQQVRWRIIEPLGLAHTSFEPYETSLPGVVPGYLSYENVSDINMSIVWGAGGVVSTVEDLGRFADALFRGGLLSPESLTEMHGFVGVDGAWGTRHLVYGLGLMQDNMSVAPYPNGQPRPDSQGLVRGHTGALAGYRAAMWYLPESGTVIVAGVNQMYYDTNIIVTAAMDEVLPYLDRFHQLHHETNR